MRFTLGRSGASLGCRAGSLASPPHGAGATAIPTSRELCLRATARSATPSSQAPGGGAPTRCKGGTRTVRHRLPDRDGWVKRRPSGRGWRDALASVQRAAVDRAGHRAPTSSSRRRTAPRSLSSRSPALSRAPIGSDRQRSGTSEDPGSPALATTARQSWSEAELERRDRSLHRRDNTHPTDQAGRRSHPLRGAARHGQGHRSPQRDVVGPVVRGERWWFRAGEIEKSRQSRRASVTPPSRGRARRAGDAR